MYLDAFAEVFSRAGLGVLVVATPPSELIRVTCTGYVSRSAAQKLVAGRGWGATTHAYHMGCYAAFPALRMAVGGLRPADVVGALTNGAGLEAWAIGIVQIGDREATTSGRGE